jgi:hypothetical protein
VGLDKFEISPWTQQWGMFCSTEFLHKFKKSETE